MSWKPMVRVNGTWNSNGLRFATEKEARDSSNDLSLRWTAIEETNAEESTDPVNYTYVDHILRAPSYKKESE